MVSKLGLKGKGPAVDSILKGIYIPPDNIDKATAAYLRTLESPVKENLGNIPLPEITQQDNIDDLRKMHEKTSSSPSGLHYGLWKANSKDKELNEIDTIFRNLTYRCGKSLTRWKKALDVELLKEEGNFNIEKQRIVVLIEGYHQLNAKRLG